MARPNRQENQAATDQRIARLREAGVSITDIAELFAVARSAIERALQRLVSQTRGCEHTDKER